MGEGAQARLDGRWALERVGGLLPPLRPLHKLIEGRRGATRLGSVVRLPFDVRDGSGGPELVYRRPLGVVRDRLKPDPRGGWTGETVVLGVVVGRFRMTPSGDAPGRRDRMRDSLALARRQPPVAGETAHRPWPLPRVPWVVAQTWEDTLFLHWDVEPAALREALPRGLDLETFEGRAWVTVTPLMIRASRSRAVPPVLPWSDFPELNLRTYVRVGDRPGIYFFSLDAQSAVVVALARAVYHLPYRRARIALGRAGDEGWVGARRREAPDVAFSARLRAGGEARPVPAGSLDHWLLERYCCYGVDRRGGLWRTDIHHPPWRVRVASATVGLDTLTTPLGTAGQPLLAHVADRQHALIWPPRPLGGRPAAS